MDISGVAKVNIKSDNATLFGSYFAAMPQNDTKRRALPRRCNGLTVAR